ncbi:MAG TPA: PAS domain S-box protein [Myxococcales bacterium]
MLEDYRHLFDANPSPMLIYATGSLELLAVNDALLATLGYTREELVGKSLLALHPAEDRELVREVLAPIQSGQVLGFHRVPRGLRHLHKDGSIVEVEAAGQPTDFDGKPARLVLLSDVGMKRRAEDVTTRYRALFERSRDIILFVAADGRILDANPAAVRAYGYWREELLRMRIVDLRDPGTVPDVPRQMQRAQGEGIVFETIHRRKDGTSFAVEVNSGSIDLHGEKVLISVIRDLSERRRLEQRLTEASPLPAQLDASAGDPEAVRRLAAELRLILTR